MNQQEPPLRTEHSPVRKAGRIDRPPEQQTQSHCDYLRKQLVHRGSLHQ